MDRENSILEGYSTFRYAIYKVLSSRILGKLAGFISNPELQYLKKAANQFCKTTPNDIVAINHKEPAWIENEENRNFISYE